MVILCYFLAKRMPVASARLRLANLAFADANAAFDIIAVDVHLVSTATPLVSSSAPRVQTALSTAMIRAACCTAISSWYNCKQTVNYSKMSPEEHDLYAVGDA